MSPEEFEAVYPHVMGWINQTVAAHAPKAKTIASCNFKRLPSYFSEGLLSSAKTTAVARVPVPPLSALGLSQFSDFENTDYNGITYLDTYFVKQSHFGDESLHFHELIHVVQWGLLGPEGFLAAYADGLERFGYADSPLEKMAYEAQGIFAQSTETFDAEKFVSARLS